MNLLVIVPKVVRSYIAQFPEVRNNAYKYFFFDNRVVDESVERGDLKSAYHGPDDFSDMAYDNLLVYAQSMANPILLKYSPRVAAEDALHLAIRDFGNGLFDGKVNANRYNVLLAALETAFQCPECITAKQKKEKKEKQETEKPTVLKPIILKQLGLKQREIPRRERVRVREQERKQVPVIFQEKGKTILKKEE